MDSELRQMIIDSRKTAVRTIYGSKREELRKKLSRESLERFDRVVDNIVDDLDNLFEQGEEQNV